MALDMTSSDLYGHLFVFPWGACEITPRSSIHPLDVAVGTLCNKTETHLVYLSFDSWLYEWIGDTVFTSEFDELTLNILSGGRGAFRGNIWTVPSRSKRSRSPKRWRLYTQNILIHPVRSNWRCSQRAVVIRVDIDISQYWNKTKKHPQKLIIILKALWFLVFVVCILLSAVVYDKLLRCVRSWWSNSTARQKVCMKKRGLSRRCHDLASKKFKTFYLRSTCVTLSTTFFSAHKKQKVFHSTI